MTSLKGVRVLVVEDEAAIALMIEDMLQDMECIVAGSAADIAEALKYVEAAGFDFALLDLNLRGENTGVVAEALLKAEIPFAFASGYSREGVPSHLQDKPIIRKPFTISDLEKVLRKGLSLPK